MHTIIMFIIIRLQCNLNVDHISVVNYRNCFVIVWPDIKFAESNGHALLHWSDINRDTLL